MNNANTKTAATATATTERKVIRARIWDPRQPNALVYCPIRGRLVDLNDE